jgi:hypothetical protein
MGPGSPRSGATAPALRAYAMTPTTNGLTAHRMRLHMASAGYGTCGPFAPPAIRPRLAPTGDYPPRASHFHGGQRKFSVA